MKKSALFLFFVTSLVVSGWVLFGLSSSRALAQETEETPTAVVDTETPTPVVSVEVSPEVPTSTPTPVPPPAPEPDLTVIKSAALDNDLNKNGNIDPGEDVAYRIRIVNNGAELSDLVIEDRFNWDNFKNPVLDNSSCFFTGDKIVCRLDTLSPGVTEISYRVTLKDVLDFQGKSSKEVRNEASVLVGGILQATASTAFQVSAPTPTPSPTVTPTDTPVPSATPNPTPTQSPSGASALGQNWSSTIIVVLLAFVGIAVFTYMGGFASFYRKGSGENKETGETTGMSKDEIELVEKRITVFREGVIIIFIVSTVLLMGIAGALQSDGVISLLSAIVGYVFGRASSRG
jgi:hypothetical protein